MRSYNAESYSMRHAYAAQLHLPGPVFRELVVWALQSLPDEILVGLDVDPNRKHIDEVESAFEGQEHVSNLLEVRATSSRRLMSLTVVIPIPFIISQKNGPMISFQDNEVLGRPVHTLVAYASKCSCDSKWSRHRCCTRNHWCRHDSWSAIFTRRTTPLV